MRVRSQEAMVPLSGPAAFSSAKAGAAIEDEPRHRQHADAMTLGDGYHGPPLPSEVND